MLMVAAPIALLVGLLWVANNRADRLEGDHGAEPGPAEARDVPASDDRAEPPDPAEAGDVASSDDRTGPSGPSGPPEAS